MYHSARHLIDAHGGIQTVSAETGLSAKTLHTHVTVGQLPAKRFFQFCRIAERKGVQQPQRELFSFHLEADDGAASGVAT